MQCSSDLPKAEAFVLIQRIHVNARHLLKSLPTPCSQQLGVCIKIRFHWSVDALYYVLMLSRCISLEAKNPKFLLRSTCVSSASAPRPHSRVLQGISQSSFKPSTPTNYLITILQQAHRPRNGTVRRKRAVSIILRPRRVRLRLALQRRRPIIRDSRG